MQYMPVSELKRSKNLWASLSESKEVVLTRDGKPGALMVEVTGENLEQVVQAVRGALFSQAVRNARERARFDPPSEQDIAREIQQARQ